jgi:hypothetical protein
LFTICVTRSSTYFTGRPTSIERKPANVGTLCMKNLEPKLPPAATGTSRSLLAGTCSEPAISHRKYVKFMEFA